MRGAVPGAERIDAMCKVQGADIIHHMTNVSEQKTPEGAPELSDGAPELSDGALEPVDGN